MRDRAFGSGIRKPLLKNAHAFAVKLAELSPQIPRISLLCEKQRAKSTRLFL